jgi:large subunit ribosomal protein L28
MAKVCQLTGKKPSTGHNVSHSVRRTKRRFLPNLQYKRIWDEESNSWVRVRVSASAMRTLAKEPSKHEAKKLQRKLEKANSKKS